MREMTIYSERAPIQQLTFLFLLFAFIGAMAQEPVQLKKSTSVQTIDGVEYYLHSVEQGQTLWAITRAYKCTEQQIKDANPAYDGILRIGQILKIPKEVKLSRKDRKTPADAIKLHVVQRGETLYGIAKTYNLLVDSLVSFNRLSNEQLKPGQELRIPPPVSMTTPAVSPINIGVKPTAQPLADKRDTNRTLTHTVGKGETLYSLARTFGVSMNEILQLNPEAQTGLREGMLLRIPDLSAKSVVEKANPEPKPLLQGPCEKIAPALYKVALMMPFFANEAEKILIRLSDVKPPSAYRSLDFIQFYEGMLLAFNDLEKKGVNIKFYVYDTYRSEEVLKRHLEKPEMKNMDMIIGPFYSNLLETMSAFSDKHNIILVSPFAAHPSQHINNQGLVKLQPSYKNQMHALADYACDSLDGPNIILVHNNAPQDSGTLLLTRQCISEVIRSKGLGAGSFKVINYKESGFSSLKDAMHKEKNNMIITLIEGEAFVASYLTTLNKIRDDYKMYLVINPNWLSYNTIDLNHLVNLNGIGYSSYFIDYEDEATNLFIQTFRDRFKTEPDPYAFQGYGVATYFLTALHMYGKNMIKCLNFIDIPVIHTHYSFERKSSTDGFENATVNIFLYKDFILHLKYRR
jgi:LysM repeat protein